MREHRLRLVLTKMLFTAFHLGCSVMTVSFHRHGDGFFPSTGHPEDNGFGYGKKYSLNIPFNKGLTNEQFWSVFEPVMKKVMEKYQPEAIVLQCGMHLGVWLPI